MTYPVNPRSRIKICGITRIQDGVEAVRLGADAIGLVFYDKSPRHVLLQQAQDICASLPAFATVVALFLNPSKQQVDEVLATVAIDLLQFHGTEMADFCGQFVKPYIKAIGIDGVQNYAERMAAYPDSKGFLLDSHKTGAAGGTGEAFDWAQIPAEYRQSIILAGGLNADNIAQAVQQVRPYAVDLSSGVESSPGIKDAAKMAQLIHEVKRVDCEQD